MKVGQKVKSQLHLNNMTQWKFDETKVNWASLPEEMTALINGALQKQA